MSQAKPDLTLVYRSTSDSARSIERLFGALEPFLAGKYTLHRLVVPCGSGSLAGFVQNILYVRKHARGIVHITGDVNYILPFLSQRHTVLTVHDCGYLMNLRGLKRLLYQWLWFKLPCWKATRITAISDATLRGLERLVGSFKGKTSVIDNCIPASIGPTPRAFNSTRPRILQIGSGHHKNLDGLIQAADGLPCELKIVGNPSVKDRRELADRQIPHSIESNVTDARIKEIYHESDILFFASRHEGFGLPILEAQAAGIPVITSNRYSMPWVAGEGAAVIVDPESPEEIRCALKNICRNSQFREDMILRGTANIERFLPQGVSNRYLRLYQTLGDQ